MTEVLPRFVTNREIDSLFGSARTRERWEKDGQFPPGELVSGFRSKVRIFPHYALARLAAPRTMDQSKGLQRRLSEITKELYRGDVFAELRAAFKSVLRPHGPSGISELVVALLPTHRELLRLFAAEIHQAEEELRELDIEIVVSLARIVEKRRNLFVVEVVADRSQREVGLEAAPKTQRFEAGEWVTIEEARVRGWRRDFLLPTAVIDEAALKAQRTLVEAPAATNVLQDLLADRPVAVEELTGGRELIDLRREFTAGRIGALSAGSVPSPTTRAEVTGLTYAQPAFR